MCESKWSTVISEFRLGCEGLGNKQPRSGYNRKPLCPVCPQSVPNSGLHLLFMCSALSRLRVDSGISSFISACSIRGLSLEKTYHLFITGLNSGGVAVSRDVFFERAKCMHDMRQLWLTKW